MSPSPLEALPAEILFSIASYISDLNASRTPARHPLVALSATSTHLHTLTEEHARLLLHQHAPHLLPKAPAKPNRKQPRVSRANNRKKWLRWLANTCQQCFRPSRRRAILDPGMTCCSGCDRKMFPKVTMTHATTTHHLSKLDLFTPNRLHPTLPPLTVGSYLCMGTPTVMLAEPDVLARKAHIASLLGADKANDAAYMRRRVAGHERLIEHMMIRLTERGGRVAWVAKEPWTALPSSRMRSLATAETRAEYVKKGLEKQWVAMGSQGGGAEAKEAGGGERSGDSVEQAIEIG